MQHENIVQLLDYFVDEQQIVLVVRPAGRPRWKKLAMLRRWGLRGAQLRRGARSAGGANPLKLPTPFVPSRPQWELISGPDLLDLLNECGGRLDEPTAVFYFRQLLQGIMFIHEMGLCHRDLKPGQRSHLPACCAGALAGQGR
jgi:hypothetical protein